MRYRHGCQSYLFLPKQVSLLEMGVQIRSRYCSAIQVCCGAMDCCKDHRSAANLHCIQGEKSTILHYHYRHFLRVAMVVVPSLAALSAMHLQ